MSRLCGGFSFRRLLRLAGLRWRYSIPPPHGMATAITCCGFIITVVKLYPSDVAGCNVIVTNESGSATSVSFCERAVPKCPVLLDDGIGYDFF
jgi:hypothetical protein